MLASGLLLAGPGIAAAAEAQVESQSFDSFDSSESTQVTPVSYGDSDEHADTDEESEGARGEESEKAPEEEPPEEESEEASEEETSAEESEGARDEGSEDAPEEETEDEAPTDEEIAEDLNDELNDDMAGHLTADHVSHARAMVEAAKDRDMDKRAATIAVTTSIVETHLDNLDWGDRDSVGLFQQRDHYGSQEQRLDPAWAVDAFFDEMKRVYPDGEWKDAPIGDVAQGTQRSAFPDRYQYQAEDAEVIVDHLW